MLSDVLPACMFAHIPIFAYALHLNTLSPATAQPISKSIPHYCEKGSDHEKDDSSRHHPETIISRASLEYIDDSENYQRGDHQD